MQQATHTFQLVCGIEAEVTAFTGVEQAILTSQKHVSMENRTFTLLGSILKRVGNTDLSAMDEAERLDFIKAMLSCDRKQCICEARQFTNDFDPIYDFNFEYQSVDPVKGKQSYPQTVDLGDGHFSFQAIKDFNVEMLKDKDGKKLTKLRDIENVLRELKPKVYENYEDVIKSKHVYFTLPKSGVSVRMRMLDGVGEGIGMSIKKDQRSSHTSLLMRNVCYQEKEGAAWISFSNSDLDKLHANDLECMRLVRKYVEGNVDTEIQFEHPEANYLAINERTVTIDLISELSFFFQSGTI